MRWQVNQLDQYIFCLDGVDDPVFLTQPRRPGPFPRALKGFIIEAANSPKTPWARNSNDVLPLLISLQDFYWQGLEFPIETLVFENLPHTKYSIYTKFGIGKA